MGQRSQIYVRFNVGDKKGLIANYYQWNYGERMISRARAGIEKILETLKYEWYYTTKSNVTKLSRILDANFDMRDVQLSVDIINEHSVEFPEKQFNEYVFFTQDNNDGKLIVDILPDGVKYAFLDYDASSDAIMDGEAYMKWDVSKEWRKYGNLEEDEIRTCEDNIEYINTHATLMTKEEVREFLFYDYESDLIDIGY